MKEDIIYFSSIEDYPLNINLAGTSYCDGSYIITRSKSEMFVFEYVIKGTGTIISNDKTYHASEGDVYILHKGSNHVYFSDSKEPWTKVWFNVSGELVENLVSAYRLDDVIVIKNCDVSNLFLDFLDISKSNKTMLEVYKLCAIKLHEVIAEISECIYRKNPLNRDAYILKDYLDKNINTTISLEELSNLIYRSSAQTIRIFKKEFGSTPYAYHIESKIRAAKRLLRNTNMTVKQIAYELNFSDEHYFSNVFKKATNFSPKQYRKSFTKDYG